MTRFFAAIFLLSFLLPRAEARAAESPAAAAVQPFIELDPDATTHFRERGTHKPFVAVGVNYFDPQVGWAPALWKRFDEGRVRHHLDLIHEAGFNTIRVFLTYDSFHEEKGKLDAAGLTKLRTFLRLCRERSVYVILTGPDAWEGVPAWRHGDQFADEEMLAADDAWWRAFAREVRDDPTLLAYDLFNEPTVGWDTPQMREAWKKYSATAMRAPSSEPAQHTSVGGGTGAKNVASGPAGESLIPSAQPTTDPSQQARLLEFQRFREVVGQNWTRRKTTAIRSVDPNHLITIGHIQWAASILLPGVAHYAGFDLKKNGKLLDFMTIHLYPLDWPKPCDGPTGVAVNAAYLQAVLFQASVGKPLMLGEFGWHGGGPILRGGHVDLPSQSPQDQLNWGKELIAVSRGHVCGWLNWAFADTPESTDLTRWSGCWTTELTMKPWGQAFSDFARLQTGRPDSPRDWPAYMTDLMKESEMMKASTEAGDRARLQIRAAMSR